jgi:hypothetical protein
MVFLLDESNIHSQEGISSVALIHVDSLEGLHAFDAHVLAAENRLRIRPFHWWKSNWRTRGNFLREVIAFDFGIRVALFHNPINIESVLEQALPYLITEREVHRLIVDGSKPKEYASRLKKVLRDKGITVKKLRTEADHARPALRAADCVAGVVRYHAENPTDIRGTGLYAMLLSHVDVTLEVQKMPPRN